MSKTWLIGCTVCGLRFTKKECDSLSSGCYACGSSLAKIEETSDKEVAKILEKYGQKTSLSPDLSGER